MPVPCRNGKCGRFYSLVLAVSGTEGRVSVAECKNMTSAGLDWKAFRNMDPTHPTVLEAKKIIRKYMKENKE